MSQSPPPDPQGMPASPNYGQHPDYVGAPMPAPPKKKGPGKWIALGCGGCALIVIIIVIIVVVAGVAGAGGGGEPVNAPSPSSEEVTERTEEGPATEETATEEEATEEEATEEKATEEEAEATEEAREEASDVPEQGEVALTQAQDYVDIMPFSKKGLFEQLTSEYGGQFPDDAAQYAVDNVDADWNEEALEAAKSYRDTLSMSDDAIRDQLVSEYGGQFTQEEADYALENLE
ncbi:Ltp family lipoprotein [Brachybacterium sp.]|uniref:Ltp family lipoprotein n=1 Tax=Brachybacterium sp. TaxID=1891286 RepID=UPI002ED05117